MCWCSHDTADCSGNGGLLKFVPKLPSTISKLLFSKNALTHLPSDFFSNVTQLFSIYLMDNGLSSMDQHAFRGLRNLTSLTLDNNFLDFDSVRPALNVSSLVHLQMIKNLNVTYIPDNIFLEFPLPHLHKKLQELFRGISMLTYVSIGYSSIKTITSATFIGVPHVEEINLDKNVIEVLPDGVFDHLVNLTVLRVSYNRLSVIRETTFSASTRQRLHLLDLSNNPYACTCNVQWFRAWLTDEKQKFLKFPKDYVCAFFSSSSSDDVGKVAVMTDAHKVGKYSSKSSDFSNRISQPISRRFQKVFHHQDQQPFVVTHTQEESSVSESQDQIFLPPVHSTVYLSDFLLSDQACLLSQSTSLLTAVLAAVLVVFMLTFLVLYKYRWHIRLALYEAFRGNPQRRQQQPEHEYEYDVFVSYANEDVDWVRQELIPTLEGRHGLRLCVHQRDFPVGGNIIDNISTCVHASKRVLFVLSPHFARSRWCQFELVFCQNYVMERDDVLVLTLLAPISGRDMTDAISAMFKTTTYLAWGEEDDARKAFWGRLVLAFHDIVPRQVA
ncbi:toll-like receptor Tollo [Pomacea canaliculata]|uniref:toll-like receptor Tollo n=1 Tax=Pomacea canaliculata TaxID=400727 RepID=UPI000D725920|nr:toll-like receptor Tollo [Pomacea canaliculata]